MFKRKYPAAQTHIFFDGYKTSTKDSTHLKRSKACRDIHFDLSMPCEVSRDDFLSNTFNKDRLIKYLIDHLTPTYTVTQVEADADVPIVKVVVEYSKKFTTVLVGEDTDLLVLCLALAPPHTKSLFLRPEQKVTGLKTLHIYDIGEVKRKLGSPVCSMLLLLYAFTGCDTTSRSNKKRESEDNEDD